MSDTVVKSDSLRDLGKALVELADKPFYENNGIVIYNGDVIEVLETLPNDSIDMVITSPPYNCRKDYGDFDDQMPWAGYYQWMGLILDQLYRVLRLGGTLAINVPGVVRFQRAHKYAYTWSSYEPNYDTHRGNEKVRGTGRIEPIGFKLFDMMFERDKHVREPIIWVKGSQDGEAISTTNIKASDNNPYLRPAHEMILLGSKGQWFHRGGTGRRGGDIYPPLDYTKDVWFITPESSSTHPAIFPVKPPLQLLRLFIHAQDATALDPFMGEGSTLEAAKALGLSAIGIELNPKYCHVSANKLRQFSFLEDSL